MKTSQNTLVALLERWTSKVDEVDRFEFEKLMKLFVDNEYHWLPIAMITVGQPLLALAPDLIDGSNGKLPLNSEDLGGLVDALAERLASNVPQATRSQALLYIMTYIAYWLKEHKLGKKLPFAEFRLELLMRQIEKDLRQLNEERQAEYPMFLARVAAIQAESRRVRGKDALSYFHANWAQRQACLKSASRADKIDESEFEGRLGRALEGLHRADGQYLRSDDVVFGLISIIEDRLLKRRLRLQAIENIFREAFGISPRSVVSIKLSSQTVHLHDLTWLSIKVARRRSDLDTILIVGSLEELMSRVR